MSQDTIKQHGAFSWNELVTSDLERAKGFYNELLEWEFQDIDAGGMPYTIIKTD